MSSWPAYSQYRSSGIPWLGPLPAHWVTIDSRRLFAQRKERMRLGDEQLTASQKYGVIPQREFMRLEDQKVMQVFTGAEILKHVEPGDFVISMRSFQGGLEWCGYSGCVSSAYVGIIPIKSIVPRFFKHLFKSKQYVEALQGTSNLVRDGQALRYQNFAQVPLPLIPESEQTQIARFLDYETARIDRLIEKQEQLIALLKEKRQAVISHAVTKGLDPNAPLRDSGIEWLGQVPAHWEVAPIKHVFENLDFRRVPLSTTERGERPGEFDYYGASGVIDHINGYLFDEPTILVGEDGANLVNRSTPLAFAAIGKYWVNNHAHILRPPDEAIRFWVEAIEHIDVCPLVSGSAQPKLTAEALMNLKIAFPPSFDERIALQSFIISRDEKMSALQARAIDQITLLAERRSALISAAVTGKIDVRGWKPPEGSEDRAASERAEEVA